ncbi:hook protein [Providencia sp. wls1948]|nr:hook protein [Providencia sp. wls1949]MTC07679.1 hook protein [Providencia sp. wls1948]
MQGCKQEIDMTIEQLQEENTKLKQAITDIYRNCEECEFDGSGTYYAIEQDHVNDAYELVNPT